MRIKKRDIFSAFTKGLKIFGICAIGIEVVTYTFSFLVSGIAKKDVFNILEGKDVTLGIYSLKILILINVLVPLIINCVKQLNSALVEKLKTRLRCNIKSILLRYVINDSIDSNKQTEGAVLNYYRNECEDVVAYFLEYYFQLPKIILSFSILVVMLYINPIFALVSLLPTIMMIVLVKALNKKIYSYRIRSRNNTKEVASFLNAFFENTEYFYMLGNRDKLISLYEKKCRERSRSEIKDRILDSLLGAISANSSNIALGVILLIALPFMLTGKFSVGEFVMFGYYYAFLAYLPDAIANLVKRNKQTNASLERITFMFKEKEQNSFVVNGDSYDFSLSLDNEKKEIHAKKEGLLILDGANSGSVLAAMFLACTKCLNDKKCVYVPKDPVLFDEPLSENILIGERSDRDKLSKVMEKTALTEDIKTFEDGIEKRCGKKGENLSGGQRKRAGIARALYQDADIMFLDGLTDRVDSITADYLVKNALNDFKGLVVLASEGNTFNKDDYSIIEV